MWKMMLCSRMLLVNTLTTSAILPSNTWLIVSSSVEIYGPHLPDTYIKIIPHPNSVDTVATIIPLTSSSSQAATTFIPTPESRPWAPFRTLADFEYTETAVVGRLSENLVNRQLNGFCNKWSLGGSHLTIHTYKDMQKSLEKARDYGIKVSHEWALLAWFWLGLVWLV